MLHASVLNNHVSPSVVLSFDHQNHSKWHKLCHVRYKAKYDLSYTTKLAYLAQLKGTYCSFDAGAVWHAHAEGKQRFFAWLLVQSKILTADKLVVRNWPCDTNCALCDQVFETAAHLCLH